MKVTQYMMLREKAVGKRLGILRNFPDLEEDLRCSMASGNGQLVLDMSQLFVATTHELEPLDGK
jgi:hypothetical protein